MLQCAAVCCSVLKCIPVPIHTLQFVKPHILFKKPWFPPEEPYILPKKPCIPQKEPYILPKLPYFLQIYPYIPPREPCIPPKEPYIYQKSPTFSASVVLLQQNVGHLLFFEHQSLFPIKTELYILPEKRLSAFVAPLVECCGAFFLQKCPAKKKKLYIPSQERLRAFVELLQQNVGDFFFFEHQSLFPITKELYILSEERLSAFVAPFAAECCDSCFSTQNNVPQKKKKALHSVTRAPLCLCGAFAAEC